MTKAVPALPMAITMGDAAGVGPEILLRLAAADQRSTAPALLNSVVVYGDLTILRDGMRLLNLDVPLAAIDSPDQAQPGQLNVIDLARLAGTDLNPGVLSARCGAAARAYVVRATLDAIAGHVAGVVTLPMNKEATQLTDPDFIGHTEMIAALCGVSRFSMMLTTPEVAVTHVSTHVSLREAIDRVEPTRIREVIDLTHDALLRFIRKPRIAVCGLNPHAGENGLMGEEDLTIIAPVVATAIRDGMDVSGPHPADTVFHQAIHRDQFDAIVCMYHDQGHAPMKLISFESGVNVTIGLPIVRTSVDHGTAFDIAWQGTAFTDSLGHALDYAWKLAGNDTTF